MSTRKSNLKAFDTFTKALKTLENEDKDLYKWKNNRLAITYKLAEHLHDILSQSDKSLSVDLQNILHKSSSDILVHNRKTGREVLTIIVRNDYLTESEQSELDKKRRSSECELIIGLSLLSQKSHMLIYVAQKDKLEYYHFDRNFLAIEPLKQKNFESKEKNKDQLTLDKLLKK